jgi:hypothetical protein
MEMTARPSTSPGLRGEVGSRAPHGFRVRGKLLRHWMDYRHAEPLAPHPVPLHASGARENCAALTRQCRTCHRSSASGDHHDQKIAKIIRHLSANRPNPSPPPRAGRFRQGNGSAAEWTLSIPRRDFCCRFAADGKMADQRPNYWLGVALSHGPNLLLEIAQPQVDMADRHAEQHQAKDVHRPLGSQIAGLPPRTLELRSNGAIENTRLWRISLERGGAWDMRTMTRPARHETAGE